jgi:hypothetical protein
MAIANSDGSIILSTKVDTSGIKKGLDQVKQKTKETAKTQQDQEKTTQKQTNAYEQLKKRVQEQTAALSKMKSEYANIILTEGKTSEAAQTLSSKMAMLSGVLEENKAKLAGVEQEANDLVGSFSRVGNESQESAEKPKNAYQQLEETIVEQKSRLEELRQEYASLKLTNQGNTTQAKKLKAEINNLSAKVAENEARIKSLGLTSNSAFAQMKSGLMALASYFIGIQAIFAAFRFSGEAGEFATQTEASVQRLVDIYGSASDSVGDFIDQNARALGMSKEAAASFSSVYGNLFSVWADQSTNAELTNRYLNMTAIIASKTSRTIEDTQERIRSGLLGNTEAIEDLGIFVNVKTIEMTDAFQRMAGGKSWEQLDAYTQQQIRSMAILEQATAKYGDEVADTSATIRSKFNAAYQEFKNSWGNIVNTVLLPVLKVLTQIFDVATRGLNALSGRSGQILENTEIQEESSNKTAENIEEQTKNQKEYNKELKKSLASFDDIQIISENTAKNDSEEATPPTMGNMDLGDFSINGSSVVAETSKKLEHIMRIVGVALAAVGVLLIMTAKPKTVAWGVGFIIAGASVLGVSAAASIQEASDMGVDAVIGTIMGIIGDALVAVGIVLLFKGQIPWGIGFIVAGAALMAIEYFATTEFSTDPVENALIKIMGILGTVLAAVGILLCIFGGPAALPWGIGFIIAGAVALVSAAAISSDAIVEAIRGPIGVIMAIAGAALLVLGIILTCTGNLILGIPLIVLGAAALVTPIALNWNAIVDWVKGVWDAVKGFWNKYIAPVFTAKFWLDLGKTCINGLISGFEAGVNGIIWLFESMINFVVDALNKLSFDVPDWVPGIGGKKFGFNIPRANFGRLSIPRLAQGTVVPPNREFMAILGDNTKEHEIVSPISTMKQAFMEAMVEMGGTGQTTREEHYYLNETQLMSIVHRLAKGGEKLQGVSLEDGGY